MLFPSLWRHIFSFSPKNFVREALTKMTLYKFNMVAIQNVISYGIYVEVCVAEQLTTQTADLEFQGSSLAHQGVFLDKEICSTLSLFPHTAGGVHVAILLGASC